MIQLHLDDTQKFEMAFRDHARYTMILKPLNSITGDVPTGVAVSGKELPDLSIKTLGMRKARIGKAVQPGALKGMLEVVLIYKNKADFMREGVTIQDFVPDGFSLELDDDMEISSEAREGGTMLSWMIDRVAPGEEVECKYVLTAVDPNYSLKNLTGKAFK